MAVQRRSTPRLFVCEACYPLERAGQQCIRPLLDPARDSRIRRTPVRRVVLETTILGRIVRGGDDDAVRPVRGSSAIVCEDGV